MILCDVNVLVCAHVLRIVPHPRVVDPPSTWDRAREFADSVRSAPSAVPVAPGPRHWQIFAELGDRSTVRGNLVPDAYLAALAIESGSEWITADRGFARYPGLRFRHPFEPA